MENSGIVFPLGEGEMAIGRERFIRQLESAAKRADIMARDEISALLRRAALRLRSFDGAPLEPDIDGGLATASIELKVEEPDLIRRILREWLEQNAYLPGHEFGDDSRVTDGHDLEPT